MRRIVSFPLSGGGEINVEVDDDDEIPGVERTGRGSDAVRRVAVTFDEAMAAVRGAAEATVRQFQQLASQPDTVELGFGVKLTAAAGAVVAHTEAEAQLTVRLVWHREGRP